MVYSKAAGAVLDSVTKAEYDAFDRAYKWFNKHLFGGKLPECLITLQRRAHARGYYRHNSFRARRGKKRKAEIALNPDYFVERTDGQIVSTLVHEMTHLWQCYFGNPGRGRYHNIEWADKMESIGLMPSHTAAPGGDRTGDFVSHYIIKDGPFERHWTMLNKTGFRLNWQSDAFRRISIRTKPSGKDQSKRKLTCPGCAINVWGSVKLEKRLLCVDCSLPLQLAT